MLWPNLNSPGILWKKLDRVKDCAICVNSQIFEGYPGVVGRNGEKVENLFS